MDYSNRWHKIEKLGEGGQGKVHRVLDLSKIDPYKFSDHYSGGFLEMLGESIVSFSSTIYPKNNKERFEEFRKTVVDVIKMEDPHNHGALKELHDIKDKDASDPDKAEARIKKEIKAMGEISHPNLLEILDYDKDSYRWFVSKYHPKGTLAENKDLFTGNFVSSLRAFRPLVEGVSQLHKAGHVHRDIKPENVFLDSNNNLVLGDFGLVFFADEQHTRVTEIFEKVGTRDWMAPWGYRHRMKTEDVKPTFDVFSLGKLLWAMVSKIPILGFWYFDEPQYNLQEMFPNARSIKLANPFFKKCIVEKEKDCLPDASALLEEVDKTLSIIDQNADWFDENIHRPCKVCGIGIYRLHIDRDESRTMTFGIKPGGGQSFKIFTCTHCGHVQLFAFIDRINPPAWPKG